MRILLLPLAMLMAAPITVHGFAYIGQRLEQNGAPVPLSVPGSGLAPVVWPDNRSELGIVLDLGDDAFIESALEAMDAWNIAGARFQFRHDAAATGEACNPRDRINTVAWTTVRCGSALEPYGDALALTAINFRFNNVRQRWELVDADIIIDQARQWQPYASGPPQSGSPDFRRVLIHELGHALGLEHPDEAGQQGVQAIMNSRISGIEVPQQDDLEGLAFLYGGEAGGSTANGSGGSGGGGSSGGGGALGLSSLLFGAMICLRRRIAETVAQPARGR